jgi:hypothetical protein
VSLPGRAVGHVGILKQRQGGSDRLNDYRSDSFARGAGEGRSALDGEYLRHRHL